jgi:prepilin-type processing-associated H-X9-DG protein
MLVVIVVILILAAILAPALSKGREIGRTAKCANNLRQLQVAYMNNFGANEYYPRCESVSSPRVNDEVYPPYTYYVHEAGWVSWREYVNGYTQSMPIVGTYDWRGTNGLQCLKRGTFWNLVNQDPTVYACPTFLMNLKGIRDALRSYSLNQKFAGGTSLYEGSSTNVLFGEDRMVTNSPYDPKFNPDTERSTVHNGKGNVVFIDGHVERR